MLGLFLFLCIQPDLKSAISQLHPLIMARTSSRAKRLSSSMRLVDSDTQDTVRNQQLEALEEDNYLSRGKMYA